MQSNRFPLLERVFPTSLWEKFSRPYRRATGLAVTVFDVEGNPLVPRAREATLCPAGSREGRQRCSEYYRKAVNQAVEGDDPVLFRCAHGFLAFGAPLRMSGPSEEVLVLVGGPALPEAPSEENAAALVRALDDDENEARKLLAGVAVLAPRKLLGFADLARVCLQSALQGNWLKETFSQRQTQVMTLFDVASDLARVSSDHELYALALNTLGVLFDVGCAAVLLYEPGADTYRVHTAMGDLEKTLRSWNVPVETAPFNGMRHVGGAARIDDPHALGKLGLPEAVDQLFALSLRGSEGPLGLLTVINTEVSSEDEQMIRGFALQLALAIENQRLRVAVAQRTRELDNFQDMSRRFSACLEAESLFRVILEQAREITGAQKASFMVAANGDDELAVRAAVGLSDRVVEKLRVRTGQGVAGRVFSTAEPVLVQNVEKDPRFRRKNRPRFNTKSFLSLPIVDDDRPIGVVNLADKLTGDVFSAEDLKLLQSMATQATIAIGRASYYEQSRELRKISITDSLTGLLNRRYFQERLAEEVDRSARHGHPLSLMMIDIDHFKIYNDTNGHPAGDKALVMVGRALRGNIRVIDVVSRFGGEEFSIILPETRKQEALEIGERIRKEVEDLYFPGEESLPSKRLTISLGVAGFPEDARDLKTFIQRADRALYHAKAQGRNSIIAYGAPETPGSPPSPAWTKVL
jgi:diguanylate cyclase (GGDEF)-like protein